MDFKERFKGKTSIVSKEGIINNLAAPSSNPVLKSTSNTQLQVSTPVNQNQSYSQNSTHQRFVPQYSPEGKPPLPTKLPTQSQFKNLVDHPNINTTYSSNMPTGSLSGTPGKSPYLVQNPLPNMDGIDGYNTGYSHGGHGYAQPSYSNHWQVSQNMQNNQFNPNSFYNQHSQYKTGGTGMIGSPPKSGNRELQANYGAFTSNQQAKKNFENLTQQNKQKRLAEEVLRGFENQNSPQFIPSNRYGDYNQGFPTYNGFNYRPGLPMPRESHSNPPPYQHLEANGYGHPLYYDPGLPQFEHYREGNSEIVRTSSSNKTGYKPYNIRDYKEFKTRAAVQLGGLGPNLHTDQWQKEKEKRDKMAEFSQNLKVYNSRRMPSTETSFKPRREKDQEKSRREIALEFAKNVPMPKTKLRRNPREEDSDDSPPQRRTGNGGFDGVGGPLDEYEARHLNYMAQLERIKLNQ